MRFQTAVKSRIYLCKGEHKNNPCDFCWYFSCAWKFFSWKFTQLLSNTLYQVWLKCVWKWHYYAVSTKTTPISQRSKRCVGQRLLLARKRAGLLLIELTTTGSHSHDMTVKPWHGSQALGEVRRRLVDVFLWQLSTHVQIKPLCVNELRPRQAVA